MASHSLGLSAHVPLGNNSAVKVRIVHPHQLLLVPNSALCFLREGHPLIQSDRDNRGTTKIELSTRGSAEGLEGTYQNNVSKY